ncbi:MAG: radical SAM protein [Candidatus Helarchaeales archaeon]
MAYTHDTISICPECLQQIKATIYEDESDGNIYMKKTCPEHGEFKDIIASNSYYYLWRKGYHKFSRETVRVPETHFDDGPFSKNGGKQGLKGCPYDCGICENHKSATCICLIDITNRCNLRCPICFANAAVTGYVVEPTMEELRSIMEHFRDPDIQPLPPVALQISGGEPTVRNDLPEILEMAKELGFVHRMVTTNGLRFTNIDYLQEIIDAGMNAMYWQFDSATDPNVYIKTRGADLLEKKMKVIENCRELGFKDVVLVPTIARGINEHQVGPILKFATENQDVVSCIVYQPVSLCGRITQQEVLRLRYNATDLFTDINNYMQKIWNNNFGEKYYPIPTLTNFVKMITWVDNQPAFEMSSHEDCGFATIGIIETFKDPKKNKLHIIDEYFKVNRIVERADRIWNFLCDNDLVEDKPRLENIAQTPLGKLFGRVLDKVGHFALRKAVKYGFFASLLPDIKLDDPKNLAETILKFSRILLQPGWDSAANFLRQNSLLVSCMHFQDAYNMNTERVSRCLVHYGIYDREKKKVFRVPFCAFNTIHRPVFEKKNAELQEELAPVTITNEFTS